jgi:hypothetical protein
MTDFPLTQRLNTVSELLEYVSYVCMSEDYRVDSLGHTADTSLGDTNRTSETSYTR